MTAQAPAAVLPERQTLLLVIGYGSELRGDDAVGLRAAEEVARWAEPAIQAIAVHQLVPELAEAVSAARAVVFVDAELAAQKVTARPVGPPEPTSALGHTGDPAWLLGLAETLYGRRPEAWLIGIPVATIDLGAGLSPTARQGLSAALGEIRTLASRCAIVEAHHA